MNELSDEKRDEVDEVNDVSPEYELEVSYDILFSELEVLEVLEVLEWLELLEWLCDLGNSGNLKSFTLF